MAPRWRLGKRALSGTAVPEPGGVRVGADDGGEIRFEVRPLGEGEALLVREGEVHRVAWARQGDEMWIHAAGRTWRLRAHVEGAPAGGHGDALEAPMTGSLVSLEVAAGDSVDADQVLGVIEGMKMQCELRSPRAGTVSRVRYAEGDQVPGGSVIVEFVEEGGGGRGREP